MYLHPQGGEKKVFFRRNLQGNLCKCTPIGHEVHPQPEQQSIFRTVFAGRVRFGGVFRHSWGATTKKGRQVFFGKKKCTPQTKSWLRLCLRTRAIPERLRGVFTTRRYTNTRLPYLTFGVTDIY